MRPPLLRAHEPGAFEVLNPKGKAKCLLICEHASNRVPEKLGNLGLDDEALRMHMAVINFFWQKGYQVGDNQPYDSRFLRGTTVDRHADERRLPNVLIEMRNDLVARDEDCDKWAEMLGDCFKNLLQDEAIHRYYDGPDVPHDPEAERRYFEELIKMAKRGE